MCKIIGAIAGIFFSGYVATWLRSEFTLRTRHLDNYVMLREVYFSVATWLRGYAVSIYITIHIIILTLTQTLRNN